MAFMMIVMQTKYVSAEEFFLEGIGYREQALQQAKGVNFASEAGNGVPQASYAGGTHIFIRGVGLNDNPESNYIMLQSHEFGEKIFAPLLTEDDAFNSQPGLGNIAYRLPSLHNLLSVPDDFIIKYSTLTFWVTVLPNMDHGTEELSCSNTNNCKIVYQRDYTPRVHYISPPTLYYESWTQIWFDPKWTYYLIQDLLEDEMGFINAKVGGVLLDFEETVAADDTYQGFGGIATMHVEGQVGEVPTGEHLDVSMLWEVGDSYTHGGLMTHCTYDNQTCYQSQTVPVIFDISSNTTFTTGGQNLTVTGYGFENENITAEIDGQECLVTSHNTYGFNCEVQPRAASTSSGTGQAGSFGITRELYNYTENTGNYATYNTQHEMIDNETFVPFDRKLQLSMEKPYNEDDPNIGSQYKGWFVAPKTTNYRFKAACDDRCSLYLGTTPGSDQDPTLIIDDVSMAWNGRRYYERLEHQYSDWFALEEGQEYFLNGYHYDYNGYNHFSVAVEIEQSEIVPHHHSRREVQLLQVYPDQIFDTIRVTVTNMDTGHYTLVFQNAADLSYMTSGSCYGRATAGQFYGCVRKFYAWKCGGNPTVNGTYYDADGFEIDAPVDGGSAVYYVMAATLMDRQCASSITVVKSTTTSDVVVDLSKDVQLSAKPLRGQYYIECIDSEGYVSQTNNQDYWRGSWALSYGLSHNCDGLYDKYKLYDVTGQYFGTSSNGRAWLITFDGLNADPGQFSIKSSDSDPLTGDNLTYNSTTLVPYSTNVVYDPIPFEMLKTYETEPQLIVTVNGNPAVCHNMTCDLNYIEPDATITGFSFDISSFVLTVTGTNLPTTMEDMQDIIFADTYCVIDASSLSGTGITCTLDSDPVCGDHYPIVHAARGYLPTTGLSAQSIDCTISTLTPAQSLNLLGSDNITFTGTFLPKDLAKSSVVVTFDDASSTSCTPQISSSSELVCLTSAFAESDLSTTMTPSLVINGKTVTHSKSLDTKSVLYSATSITPSSSSPVLKKDVVIQLDTSFPFTLDRNDFTVNATSVDDPTYVRYLKVNEVDDAAKTLTCKFGGAESGLFNIVIRHADYGLIKSELTLDVNAYVTGVSPSTGSIYGGTLLTITGTNFGDVYTDNPVQLSLGGGIGSADCYVQTTSATEITCRIDSDTTSVVAGQGAEVIVFLKTSEEAKCEDTVCAFQYTSVIPTIEGVEAVFDTTSNTWTIVVTGTDFTGDESTTHYSVNGVEQQTLSVTSTQAIFTITDVSNNVLSGQKLLFDVGKPENHTLIEAEITLTPRVAEVTPLVGSMEGSIITILAPGVTVAQQGSITINRYHGGQFRTWNECKTTTVVSYGVIECDTLTSRTFYAYNQLAVTYGGIHYTCSDTQDDDTNCAYVQVDGSGHADLVSSSVASSTDLTLTGTGFSFQPADYSVVVEYLGVQADSVVIDSDTQVTATYNLGVPIGSGAPKIRFIAPEAGHYAEFYSLQETELENTFSVSDSTSGLECSFAGGCTYEVTSDSLAAMILSDSNANHVNICGEECVIIEDQSSVSTVKCTLPGLSTIYSNENFGIAHESEDLDSGHYFGTADDNSIAFDGNLLVPTTDDSDVCVIGMAFKENHVGMISQVKYFMQDMDANEKAVFTDSTVFQGSMSQDSGYETLFVMDEKMHSGWNYFNWEDAADYPKYRYYRFYARTKGGCEINEIIFTGVQTIQNEDDTYTCDAKAVLGETSIDLNTVEYKGSLTTNLESISPRYGTVVGGTEITFTGTNFPTDTSLYIITLDGINCPVSSATSTSVVCTSGSRPGLVATKTELYITGQGLVSNNQLVYTYVSAWSSDTTWGGEFAPMEGESIWIPEGLNLLVDIDRSPVINAIIVEGSLIFQPVDNDPNHHRYFDASYIFVTGGKMEVGTEQFPYTSKITITMHGNITDPYLPIYGNKCIGLRYGTLDMHGIERTPTWTVLDSTVEPGDNVMVLAEEVDWQVGEMIGIAPTSFNSREGEHRIITAVGSDKKTITLDAPFDYKHFAEIQHYGDDFIDMRAEVGLLSRNVVYRGDPETSGPNQYGATVFLHSQGDDSLTARLTYTEFTDVGQAFKLGRYAIHFHMIGAVHNSYAHGNAIHQSNNRAFTMHGTHYLRLTNNVVYEGKGHIFFIEDAIETNNYCEGNLVMKVKRSWSLLNTDQSPAGFWITHPNNHILNNHVGGSDRYGFWYDLQEHAMGPSANLDVCPENDRVGEFANNAAHTMGRYGLRIFHTMEPRTYPCMPMVYDESNQEDPFWQNPPIEANFYNYTGWKCNRDGAIAKKLGFVRFNNFKTADNREAGIQMSQTLELKFGNYSGIFGKNLVIGQSNNVEATLLHSNPTGVIGPRTENWQAHGISFYNFNWNEAAAFGSCSHCWHPQTSDQGARQYDVSNMYLDESVTRVFKYGTPFNGIYHDLDGSVTGLGPDSWATHFEASHNVPECQMDLIKWDGHVCNSSVQVKGINFFNGAPNDVVGIGLKILPYDDYLIDPMTEEELEAYIDNEENYGTIEWKTEGWGVPFVTGHKYKIHLGKLGNNFENLDIMIPQHYSEDDLPLYLIHNFTENRENLFVTKDGEIKANETIPDDESKYVGGQNVLYNWYPKNEFHMIINGKGKPTPKSESYINLEAIASCGPECIEALEEVTEKEDFFRYWSDGSNWPNNQVPQDDSEVEIRGAWNMILDVEETPKIKVLKIHGRLTFSDEMDVHLRVKHVSIRGGEFHIGSSFAPYEHNARITLLGVKDENAQFFDGTWLPGSKMIANAGLLSFYGQQRTGRVTRLQAPAFKDTSEIQVETLLDWVAGDRIALAPTSYKYEAGEDVIISSYDRETGIATLETPLVWYHWGQATSTANDYNGLDMRGEVVLLSRNIVVAGEDVESWGGRVITGDSMEFSNGEIVFKYGQTLMDNVEIYNCSQQDSYDAAIGWNSAITLESSVTNSAIHNGLGWAVHIEQSKNVVFDNNVMFNFRPFGLVVEASQDVIITNNVLIKVVERDTIEANWSYVDAKGGYAICAILASSASCSNVTVNYNIAAGITQAGFWAMFNDCDEDNERFYGNVAHSVYGTDSGGHGAIFFNDKSRPQQNSECMSASYFSAYKCAQLGATSHVGNTIRVDYHHMTMVDNAQGFGPVCGVMNENINQEYLVKVYDNKIYGELVDNTDCPIDGSFCVPTEKKGMMLNGCSLSNRGEICTQNSCYPWQSLHGGGVNRQRMILERNSFYNFNNESMLGMGNHAITLNSHQSDYHPISEFYDTYFYNVTSESMAYMHKPQEKWANMADCGEFPCTAPLNALFDFKRTVFEGENIPVYASSEFQVIPDNEGFSPHVQNCQYYLELNGYACNNNDLGVMIFESEDTDKWDRSMQPIYMKKEGTDMNNKLNSYMDHMWDGFYTGQVRLSRFPTLMEASAGSVTEIQMTGTPPKKMLFRLKGGVGTTIRIAYPGSESRAIYKDGTEISYNAWDDSIAGYGPVTQSFCGENRFIGVQNILEFYITEGCELQIKPRNAIQTKVRMEWTLDEFFSGGGTTTFVDRITASLGIHASEVKIVSVYEGSLVVNYEVSVPDDDAKALDDLKQQQDQMFEQGAVDLGAPVLAIETALVVNDEKQFTATKEKVYVIELDTTESDKAWRDSYITWDYEPVVVLPEDEPYNPQTDYVPYDQTEEYEQDVDDRDMAYEQDMSTFIQEQESIQYEPVSDSTAESAEDTYEATQIRNRNYQQNNVGSQNQFEGADVVTEQTTIYQGVTVQKEKEPETVYKYTKERTVIVDETTPEIEDIEDDDKAILIPIALSLVLVTIVAICIKQLLDKSDANRLKEAETRAMKIRDLNDQEMSDCKKGNVIDLGAAMKQNDYSSVGRDSSLNSFSIDIKGGAQHEEYYQAQYDPSNDFAVFGIGDQTRGGVQSMKEKMNLADAIDVVEEESDETSPMNAADPGKHEQLPQISDKKAPSVPMHIENVNDLPEDQEIVSDGDEE